MNRSRHIAFVALALSSGVAHAFQQIPIPLPLPPLEPICNPEINPDCGKVVVTNPGDGTIYPDPTLSMDLCAPFWDPKALFTAPLAFGSFNPYDERDTGIWVQTRWDERYAYYTRVLDNVDPGGQLDFGTTMADLDGDGALDLVVGIPHSSAAARDGGALAIFYGPIGETELDMDRPDAMIYGVVRGGELGLGVGRKAGEEGGPDGLRVNSPYEGLIYVIPATGELPERLDESFLSRAD